jgi:hypothetical protein
MGKFLDSTGLTYLWQRFKEMFVAKESGKGLSTNDFTTALKNKLDGIATGATKVTVDTVLSSTSSNPVQNKIITDALNGKSDSDHSHSEASTTAKGFMSASDKTKLNALPTLTTLESTYAKKSDITSAYKAKGNSETIPALANVSVGDVYNITAEFTTTNDFVEGAGKKYPAGTNIVKNADSKWDVMAGFVDLTGYAQVDQINQIYNVTDGLQDQIDDITALTNTEIDTILAS